MGVQIASASDGIDVAFILSYTEASNHMTEAQRMASGTSSIWWLRSRGNNVAGARYVLSTGGINVGSLAVTGTCAVRPALWIK